MLNIITGAAKSGKTTFIYNQIAAIAAKGEKSLLIVPEQASFNNEKNIAQRLGKNYYLAEVMSFSRLSHKILQSQGGDNRPVADETAKAFLMNVALNEVGFALKEYTGSYKNSGFISQMITCVEELSNCGIESADLYNTAKAMKDGRLKTKLGDIALIYDSYFSVMHRGFLANSDVITQGCQKLYESAMFKDYTIFIDDFGGFTAPEILFIKGLLETSKQLTITVVAVDLPQTPPAFLQGEETIAQLINIANQSGKEISFNHLLDNANLPAGILEMELATRNEDAPNTLANDFSVNTFVGENPYEELRQLGAEISRLVIEEGYKYQEIAVIARSLSSYEAMLPRVFNEYEIPYFWDVSDKPLSQLLTATILEATRLGAKSSKGDWLNLARLPLMGIDPQIAGELENYCYIWSVKNSMWKNPFELNPNGMKESFSKEETLQLEKIEQARKTLVQHIEKLSTAFDTEKGQEIAKGLYDFLADIDFENALTAFAEKMPVQQRELFLEQQNQIYSQFVLLLELFFEAGEEISFEPKRVEELVEIALNSFTVATPPQSLDAVAIGVANRMRCEDVKATFIIGAVEGEFPLLVQLGGVLSKNDREALLVSGLTLINHIDKAQATEKMFCYRAITAPKEKLFVSFPSADTKGAPLMPSEIFTRALAIRGEACKPDLIWSKKSLERSVAEKADKQLLQFGQLTLKTQQVISPLLAKAKEPHQIKDIKVVKNLFGEKLRLAPSRIEGYYQCPFSYFMQKGLKANLRQKAQLTPLQSGTLIHRVLEKVISTYSKEQLATIEREALKAIIIEETQSYLKEVFNNKEVPKRLQYNFVRIGQWLFEMVLNMARELAQSEFSPFATELVIGENSPVAPLEITTPKGAVIEVSGTIDRVDTAIIEGEKYARVIDYKSGGKKFSFEEAYYGLSIQLLVYLSAIAQNGKKELDNCLGAGAFYMPTLGGYIKSSRDEDGVKLEEKQRKQYTMSGIVLDKEEVLTAMEKELEGYFIPCKEKKTNNPLYSPEKLEEMFNIVKTRIGEMGDMLFEGRVEAMPATKPNGTSPCDYCDYSWVCGFEESDPVRMLEKIDREDIL